MAEGARILVVDDDPDIQLLCRVNLEFEGYVVSSASDGAEALELVAERPPDAIVLDVMMPGMSGWELLDRLKSDEATASIPVVMLTAKTLEQDQLRGLVGGASEYVTKPFSPLRLSQAVNDVLAGGEQHDRERRERILAKLRRIRAE